VTPTLHKPQFYLTASSKSIDRTKNEYVNTNIGLRGVAMKFLE